MKPADADDVLMMRAIKTNKKTNKNHQATTNLWARCVFMCVLLRRLVWRLRSDFHAHRPSGCNSAFLQYRAASTLSACHVRWAGDEATSPDVCGNSWNSRQLGECLRRFFFFFFGEIHPKQLADWRYLIVALNTVITKLSVKFLREYKQNNELQGREGGIASCVLAVWRLKEWTYE